MANNADTNGIVPPEEMVGTDGRIQPTGPLLPEEMEVTSTMTGDTESTVSLQLPVTEVPSLEPSSLAEPLQETPMHEAPAHEPTQEMPASEAFVPNDLAMEHNPMTMADAPLVDHSDSNTVAPVTAAAAESLPDHTNPSVAGAEHEASIDYSAPPAQESGDDNLSGHANAPEHAHEIPNQPETSATGWLVPPAAQPASRITFDEYLTLSEITFEWGDSYDCKDWMRLAAILAPSLAVDYTEVNGHRWDSMPAADFVGILSHIGFVGDPLVHTQHHIGASKWQKISNEEVIGHHQLRAAHQRYTNSDLNVVENKGHGHAMVRHYYRKLDGEWKLAGLRPAVRWNEFEFDKIFKGL